MERGKSQRKRTCSDRGTTTEYPSHESLHPDQNIDPVFVILLPRLSRLLGILAFIYEGIPIFQLSSFTFRVLDPRSPITFAPFTEN